MEPSTCQAPSYAGGIHKIRVFRRMDLFFCGNYQRLPYITRQKDKKSVLVSRTAQSEKTILCKMMFDEPWLKKQKRRRKMIAKMDKM